MNEHTEIKPVQERDNLNLLELVCQLHSRVCSYPHNRELHEAYIEARKELEGRLSQLPPVDENWKEKFIQWLMESSRTHISMVDYIERNIAPKHQLPPVSQSAGVWVKIRSNPSNLPEENDCCLWAKFPVEEPPYCGSLLDVDFPKPFYFTHYMILKNEFFNLDESPVSQPQPQQGNVDDEYPTEEQIGGGKQWDLMTELEQTYYKLMKCKNALAVSTNTVKRLREGASPLPDELKINLDELRGDKSEGSMYYAWQANIAMALKDEWHRAKKRVAIPMSAKAIHEIANQAAKNFLDILLLPSPADVKDE